MATRPSLLRPALLAALLASAPCAWAEQNFQVTPPPIAYPYFEAGKTDSKFEPMIITIDSPGIQLSGGGANFVWRKAKDELLALDAQGSFFMLTGEMPGIGPITPIPAYSTGGSFLGYYVTQPTGKAKVTLTSLQMSMNGEAQPLHTENFGLIVFGGPNFGMMVMRSETPYQLYWPPTGTTYSGYTDRLTTTVMTVGFQFGMQADIGLADGVHLTPFFMLSTASGTAEMQDTPGAAGASVYSSSADIPAYSTTSMGMDIVIGDFSIGTLLQKMEPSDSGAEPVNTSVLRFGMRF